MFSDLIYVIINRTNLQALVICEAYNLLTIIQIAPKSKIYLAMRKEMEFKILQEE